MSKKKWGGKIRFNASQLVVREIYAAGDMSHVDTAYKLKTCGDGLFQFLMSELGDDDTDSKMTHGIAVERIEQAVTDLHVVLVALRLAS